MRMIDADALMELARNHVNKTVDCNDIARFPTVDAEPVVHARWEYIEDYAYSRIGWHCTSCRKRIPNEMVAFAKRCHHCGAKMDAPRGEDDA